MSCHTLSERSTFRARLPTSSKRTGFFVSFYVVTLLAKNGDDDHQNQFLIFFIFLTGINKKLAVDAAYFPVVSSDEPRAVGLPQDPHGNTMLSCLSSGFLCPLTDTAIHSEATLPEPGSHHTTHSGSSHYTVP